MSPPRPTLALAVALSIMAAALHPRLGHAQTPAEMEARRALLEQVRTARTQGHHEEALQLLERAGEISMNSSIRRASAQELQALQRWADAFGQANECVSEANREASTPARDQVVSDCQALVTQSQTHVGHVVVQVPSPEPAGMVVRIAGQEVPHALLGVAYPVNAGRVEIEVRAPHRTTFHQTIDVAATSQVPVAVTLPAEAVAGASTSSGSSQQGAPAEETHHLPIPALALMGVGVIGLVVGAIMTGLRVSATSTLDGECSMGPNPICPHGTGGLITQANIGNVGMIAGFAVGGVALAGGALLWLLSPRSHASERRQAMRVMFGPGCGGNRGGVVMPGLRLLDGSCAM